MKILPFIILIFTLAYSVRGENQEKNELIYTNGNYQFEWDITADKARAFQISINKNIWQGSLLPAFWLQDANNIKRYVKSIVFSESKTDDGNETKLMLQFAELGTGSMVVKKENSGISITDFQVRWNDKIPEIIDLYFGTSSIPAGRQSLMDEQNPPFSSDWEAMGYCIPGAKEGTVQSYFRNWDFGSTNISLGSYATSMGSPYGAAFPRPTLALAMGNDQGWMVLGAGSIPDAPMTLKIRSSLGCINFLYREDLWGPGTKERIWENPLCITFGESAWQAYRQYFNFFPGKKTSTSIHSKAIWNTWGNWRNKEYPIRPISDFAKQIEAEIFVIDDPWEASQGLGKPNITLFPDIEDDLEYVHKNNMTLGIWETIGWVSDTLACGLSKADLICDQHGIPCIGSWSFSPFTPGYFCIDISSQRSRKFLKERTINTMKTMKPKLIKLDFGYGIPNPNWGVSRNPELRGEKYPFELMKLIVEAAKSVDPDVTIMYYGINPLYLPLFDIISLDDQGDLWYEIKEGHAQWSIWASLLCDKQVAISGSSSYNWHADDEIILNTFILGAPGTVLATHLDDGSMVPEKYLNRRYAINKWYRKTIRWEPLWLDSQTGNLQSPPKLNCWGRLETFDGKEALTALILRDMPKPNQYDALKPYNWEGRWAIISQDNKGITESDEIVLVPFDEGFITIALPSEPKKITIISTREEIRLENWLWKDGKLTIQINEQQLCKTAGFKVLMK